jgi:hypothetical protein
LLASESRSPWAARPASAAASSKANRFFGPGRLPSTSALHPTALLAHRRTRLRRSSSALALGGAPRSRVERGCRGDYRLQGRNRACDEPASLLACSWLFATAIRLPAPLHPPSLSSPHGVERRWARPSRALVRGGRGPNAARRLLQYKQSASTTCESTDPHVTEHPELTLARSARLTCFRPRGPEPPPDPRLAPGIWLRHREAPKALLDRDLRLVVEACASSSAADGFCLALPSNITRDLATPNVAIGECAACANRGLTGQGPMASAVSMSLSGPPAACRPKACSRRSFAPTRSARTPPVVESLQG